ncbi:type II secretion system protein H (GspH) [Rhizobiales bacterium GAS191]|nr:type II secretion system protein H (GspH) [Rhizobiales bacterium GAS191]
MSQIGKITDARGFTLLEMMIVLSIVALVFASTGFVLSDLRVRRTLAQLEAQVDEALYLARADALRSGLPYRVVFSADRLSIQGPREVWAKPIPRGVEFAVTAARETSRDQEAAIAFFGDGASSGGRITLRQGDHQFSRSVSWLTGAIDEAR